MGTNFSTNSQCGNIKFNQFPVLVFTEHWNKYFHQFLPEEIPVIINLVTNISINFHQWIGDGWVVLFSHPKDFTPVCTTELGYAARLKPDFQKRNCKIIGLSVDSVEDHERWSKDIAETQGHAVNYPLIGDTDLEVAKLYDMLHPNARGEAKDRTPGDNQTVRSVFIIGSDKKSLDDVA